MPLLGGAAHASLGVPPLLLVLPVPALVLPVPALLPPPVAPPA
jgi:hypothetical protein